MNGDKILADTNIIIYLLNGEASVAELLEGKSVYLSFITEIELLTTRKLNQHEEAIIHRLISQSTIVDVNTQIKKSNH